MFPKIKDQVKRHGVGWVTTDGATFTTEADARVFQRLINFRAWYQLVHWDDRPLVDADEMFEWIKRHSTTLGEVFGPWLGVKNEI